MESSSLEELAADLQHVKNDLSGWFLAYKAAENPESVVMAFASLGIPAVRSPLVQVFGCDSGPST